MKTICIAILLASVLCFGAIGSSAFAQDVDTEAIQVFLKKYVGEWSVDATVYSADGGEFYATGKETVRMVGEWLTSDSEIVEAQITFHGVIGFDEEKEKIVGVGIASNKAVMILSEGEFNKERNELVMFMEGSNMAGQLVKQKEITTFPKDGERLTEIYQRVSDDDEWEILFELTYARTEK